MVLNYLREQGFSPRVNDDGAIFFKYQLSSFIYPNNDNDTEYFQILYPAIYSFTADQHLAVLNAVNEMNSELKVAKTFVVHGNSVWMAFEILLDSTPNVADIFPRALSILTGGRQKFYKKVSDL